MASTISGPNQTVPYKAVCVSLNAIPLRGP